VALSTYDELVDSIDKWTFQRGDLELLIPDFILAAEQEMYANDVQILETRTVEKTSTAVTDGTRFLGLPDNFLQQRDFRIERDSSQIQLNFTPVNGMVIQPSTGVPTQFTVTNQIEFNVVPDKNYNITMKYYAKPTALSSTNQTNEVLTSDPFIYLYGALHQAFLFTEDDNEAAKYYNKFISAIKGANKRAKVGRYGATPAMKLRSVAP